MPVVAIPDPPDPIGLPAICVVTGRQEGVRPQPVPLAIWSVSDPVVLPVTDPGLGEVVSAIRSAQGIVLGALVATIASLGGLDAVFPWVGNGRYLSLVLFVIGVLVARTLRQRTVYGVSNRNGVRVLFVPDPSAAEALREAVRRAALPADLRRQLASAEQLAALNEGNHPLAD